MDMTLRTSSSQLKAKLGEYMRAVRAGREVIVTDREEPVARLVPYREPNKLPVTRLEVSRPRDPTAPPLGQVQVRPIRYQGRETGTLLVEDRSRR
jgi:prevent-host-death family protein